LEVETPVEHEGYRIWSVQAVGRFFYPKLGFSSRGGVLVTSYSSFGTLDYLLLLVPLSMLMFCLELLVQLWTWKMNKFIRPSDDRLKERRNKSYRSTAEERGIRDEEMRRRTRRRKENKQCTVKICCCGCKADDG